MSQVDKLTKNVDESNKVIKSSYETTRRLEVQLQESATKLNLAAKEIQALKMKLESSEVKVSLLEDRLSDAEHADFSSQTGPETIENISVKNPVKKDLPNPKKPLKQSPPKPAAKNPIITGKDANSSICIFVHLQFTTKLTFYRTLVLPEFCIPFCSCSKKAFSTRRNRKS